MNRSNSLPIVIAIAACICWSAIAPELFAAIIGIGVILIVAAFILGGFVFLMQHWNMQWPVGIVIGFLALGLFWPPLLGFVIGAGLVGGLFWTVYQAIGKSGR